MNNGFILLHRKFIDWEWYSETNTKTLFIHCLFLANWEDKKWRGIEIKRGQFYTSLSHLAESIDLSIRSVRTSLDRLKMTNELIVETTSKGTKITVCKYDTYQQFEKQNDKQTTRKTANERQGGDKPTTTTKELKEYNKEILFEQFWNLYPVKKGKAKCEPKWKNISDTDKIKIMETLPDFIKHKPFADYNHPHPETYINQKRWEDVIVQPKNIVEGDSLLSKFKNQELVSHEEHYGTKDL